MAILVFGLIVFLGVHSVRIVLPGFRARMIERGGAVTWKLAYTGMAVIGLVLIILGYGLARRDPVILYNTPAMLRHSALLVMLPVFPLLFAAYIKGRIWQRLHHPMLIATILWAMAHLMANGSLADVLLFGSFLIWAGLDWLSLLKRKDAPASSTTLAGHRNDVIAVVAGLLVYAVFLGGLHAWLFGVAPV